MLAPWNSLSVATENYTDEYIARMSKICLIAVMGGVSKGTWPLASMDGNSGLHALKPAPKFIQTLILRQTNAPRRRQPTFDTSATQLGDFIIFIRSIGHRL